MFLYTVLDWFLHLLCLNNVNKFKNVIFYIIRLSLYQTLFIYGIISAFSRSINYYREFGGIATLMGNLIFFVYLGYVQIVPILFSRRLKYIHNWTQFTFKKSTVLITTNVFILFLTISLYGYFVAGSMPIFLDMYFWVGQVIVVGSSLNFSNHVICLILDMKQLEVEEDSAKIILNYWQLMKVAKYINKVYGLQNGLFYAQAVIWLLHDFFRITQYILMGNFQVIDLYLVLIMLYMFLITAVCIVCEVYENQCRRIEMVLIDKFQVRTWFLKCNCFSIFYCCRTVHLLWN